MSLVKTDLVFTRHGTLHLEILIVARFTHIETLKTTQEVLDALENAITHWIETTPAGLEAWEESCEDFNIGDFYCQNNFQLQASLEAHGIHSVETLFELADSHEVSFDRILAHPDLEPEALYRDDGEKFSRNDDGSYSMDNSHMVEPYCYNYKDLLETGKFFRNPPQK